MSSDMQKAPVLIKTEFLQVIKDFSQYLNVQKQMGNHRLGVSEASAALLNNWGTRQQDQADQKGHTGHTDQTGQTGQAAFCFEGPETADIFFIDGEGSFFNTQSGDLLKKILAAMNLTPDAVFICDAGNAGLVHNKIKRVAPKMIITLGTKAGRFLLNTGKPLERFHGKFHDYNGIRVMPTFHPSRLLKQPEFKRQVWEDMKRVMEVLRLNHGS